MTRRTALQPAIPQQQRDAQLAQHVARLPIRDVLPIGTYGNGDHQPNAMSDLIRMLLAAHYRGG